MNKSIKAAVIAAATAGLFAAAGSFAADGQEILKTKGCLNCHDMEKKKVGPAFKDVAAKNQGKGDALAAKISGAKGHPKVNATEAEVKAAVDAVLSAK
jgi:cytochrome c